MVDFQVLAQERGMKLLLAFLALLLLATSTHAAIINSGHTSVWRDPARSGEGFTLEVLNETTASLAWFTFDEGGDPRWAYAVGSIVRGDDERIEFADVFRSRGGVFGPAYDPDSVTTERVGSATLRFEDCDQGTFSFDAFGQAMDIEVQRLTRTMASGCAPIHGIPGEVIQPYAGQSGIWRDVSRFGQGMQLQWIASSAAVLGWYTFDAKGNAYWLTGLGTPVGEPGSDGHSRIVFETLYAPRGARFGAAFDPDDVELVDWGRAELELTCDSGVLRFESNLPAFGSGERQIQLLTRSVPAACPWVKPKLTDLYDLEFLELPLAPDGLDWPVRFAKSIADDRTVLGCGDSGILRLRHGSTDWELLANDISCTGSSFVYITPDSGSVFARKEQADGHDLVVRWRESTGWRLLTGARLGHESEVLYGMSLDGTWLVGKGRIAGETSLRSWKWSEDTGQIQLPSSEDVPLGTPGGISSDGTVVVGVNTRLIEGFPHPVAIRWQDDQTPALLLGPDARELAVARTCDADCGVVFGSGWHRFDDARPESGDAWYWKQSGGFGYLGHPEDALLPSMAVSDASIDGSVVIGSYATATIVGQPPYPIEIEAWVWTPNTGMVSLRQILNDELQVPGPWEVRDAVSATSDGRTILLSGSGRSTAGTQTRYRAAILHLVPMAASAQAAVVPARRPKAQ
jgi:hypothetical protein